MNIEYIGLWWSGHRIPQIKLFMLNETIAICYVVKAVRLCMNFDRNLRKYIYVLTTLKFFITSSIIFTTSKIRGISSNTRWIWQRLWTSAGMKVLVYFPEHARDNMGCVSSPDCTSSLRGSRLEWEGSDCTLYGRCMHGVEVPSLPWTVSASITTYKILSAYCQKSQNSQY